MTAAEQRAARNDEDWQRVHAWDFWLLGFGLTITPGECRIVCPVIGRFAGCGVVWFAKTT